MEKEFFIITITQYIIYFISLIFLIIGTIYLLKGNGFISKENKKKFKKIIEKNKFITTIFDKGMIFIIFIFPFIYLSFYYIPDFMNVINKNYVTIECTIDYDSEPEQNTGFLHYRGGNLICSNSNKKINISYYNDIKIKKGQKAKVKYLKHLKIGFIEELDNKKIN